MNKRFYSQLYYLMKQIHSNKIIMSKKHWVPNTSIVIMIALIMLFLSAPVSSISQTRSILVNPNTENSPSNLIFYFSLQYNLPSTDYLMITYSPFINNILPISCIVLDHVTTMANKCVNLQTGTDITIAPSQINQVNPNIETSRTVVVQFNQALTAGVQYKIQIITNNVLPNLGTITTSFEFYTITDTGVMIEQNWNFGLVFLETRQNRVLSILNRNLMTNNNPGESFPDLLFEVTIGFQSPTPKSRLKFIISDEFIFTDSSLVTTGQIIGAPPTIISSEIISPNVILTTFDQSFAVGRKFSLRIADYLNPLKISSGFISVYHLPYNSMSPLQMNQENIPISTVPFEPTLTLLTIDGTAPVSPIQFYTDTTQYLTLTIVLPRKADADFVIKIQTQSNTLKIHEGSVFFKTSTIQSQEINYVYESNEKIIISGFPQIPTGTLLTITMEVTVPSNSIFKFFVSIDKEIQILNPIMYKQIVSNSAAIPQTFLSLLTGNQNQPNVLTSMQSSTQSKMQFTITSGFLTNDGSSFSIISPAKLKATSMFNGATSCTVAGVPEPCTIVTNTTFTNITIASNSSFNLFPQGSARAVVINNIKFDRTSSHTEGGVYHLYFSIKVSQAVSAQRKNLLKKVIVLPQRDLLTNFALYFSNDLKNVGTNYPNILRLVSKSTTQWNNIIQVYQRRIISLYAYNGWTNLFKDLTDGDQYPAKSNFGNINYIYHKGTTSGLSLENILDWDRIDIILDGSQTSNDFSIILPTTFLQNSLVFQVMIGVYNINTRTIKYLNIQPTITKSSAAIALTSKPKITTNKIQLRGPAASQKDAIQIKITPGAATYQASTSSAALIIVSDWPFFESDSTFSDSSLNNVNPDFNLIQQMPVSMYLPNNEKYLTYIPLYTPSTYSTPFSIFLDNIRLPYSHDLPYYSIYLSDSVGTIDCYNEFINQDKGVFYESNFRNLAFSCDINSLGVQNTYCTIIFNNTMKIMQSAVIRVYFTGMLISTNICEMKDVTTNIDVPTTCLSNTDKNLLTVTLGNTEKLQGLQQFQLLMYGVQILNNTIIHYVTVQIRDPSASYIIEQGNRILLTRVQTFLPITIFQIKYSKNNPIVFSQFIINFNLPRKLNYDEQFAIVMSKDLANLNTIQSKLHIILKDSSQNLIPIIWELSLKNYQITFEDLVNVLVPGNYSLEIYGIKTPSTIQQDLIGLIYLRNFDSSYTISNNVNSTAKFPELASKIDSKITMATKFNTEGLEQQFVFTIQNQYATVTVDTIWIINFPRYYSQRLWAFDHERYCTIDDIKLPCDITTKTPYQVLIHDSPRIIQIGETYIIRVFGIVCPRQNYLNGAADYITESIFLGVSVNDTAASYIQYSQLFVTQSVITIEGKIIDYADIIIKGVTSSNMQILQSTFFVINLQASLDILPTSYIYLTFPSQFDNFNDIQLTVVVKQGSIDQTFTASVVNRRIGFELIGMTLTSNTLFDIQISSLSTPITPSIVDMNKLKIMVTSSNQATTLGSSLQRHNLVSNMEFIPSNLHIVINNYQIVQVTAGTYSLPVKIQPSDFQTFASNMKINFISANNALEFNPQPSYGYLGQQQSLFKIGADQNLIPKIYTYDIIKSQTSISAVYTSLAKYTVLVSNIPITITIPSTMNVPLGGCSVPYSIQLENIPHQDISLNFQYDTELFTLHTFWINEQTSYNQLQFSKTITQRWLSFCSEPSLMHSIVIVKPYISGTNYEAYKLSSQTITVNIVSNTSTNVSPTFSIVKKNLQKTYAGFQITTNLNGQIYYQLKLSPLSSSKSLVSLKSAIKEGIDLRIQKQQDYLNYIYTKYRDHRLGTRDIQVGTTSFEFEELLPQQTYKLCVYFQNQHRRAASQKCIDFSTISWGSIIKASITFNSTIYQNQLNKILCYFVRASQSQIQQIVNLEGHSCSLSNSPENYNYLYKGSTESSELKETIIYFVTSKNLTTDPSIALFRSIYNTTSPYLITDSSKAFALSTFSINYIYSSYLGSSFNPISSASGSISTPSITFDENPEYNTTTKQFKIMNLKLSSTGSVYFLLTFNKRIISNQVTNHFDIQIRLAVTPSSQNIFNCLDGYSQLPLSCKRVVLQVDASTEVTFSNLTASSVYILYYVVANEYPLRPIAVGEVQNITIFTTHETSIELAIILCVILSVVGLF